MRSIAVSLVVLAAGCHDLTICRSESDGPACRDAAAADDGTDTADALADSSGIDASIEAAADTSIELDATPTETGMDASSDTADAPVDAVDASDAAACAAGSHRCAGTDGRNVIRCESDGGLSTIVICPSAATCDASLGRCTACTPGAYSCAGSERRACDSFGAATSPIATCATADLCAASSGATCVPPACAAGEKSCTDDVTMRTCNTGRTGFDTSRCGVRCAGGSCAQILALAGHATSGDICALLSTGSILCWGTYDTTPTQVPEITTAVQVALGGNRFGARLADSTVRVWMRIGGGGPEAPGRTTPVAGVGSAEDLALGEHHACVRVSGGVVKCWGIGADGQLGGGGTSEVWPPTLVTASGVTATGPVALGAVNSFAIAAGGARGWGHNDGGQLGTGTLGTRLTPVATFTDATQISASLTATCARTATGKAMCAGQNGSGQLGDGTKTLRASPVAVTGLDGLVTSVSVGDHHACALLNDKTVRCWGANDLGQLGNGSTSEALAPTAVSGLSNVKQIVSSAVATCALLNDSQTVKCWGSGPLGIASPPSYSTVPVTVVF